MIMDLLIAFVLNLTFLLIPEKFFKQNKKRQDKDTILHHTGPAQNLFFHIINSVFSLEIASFIIFKIQ